MGIKHLRKIEEYLKKNKEKAHTIRDISLALKINYYTVDESIRYLANRKLITVKEKRYYQWRDST